MSPTEGPRGRSGSPATHTPGKSPTPGPWRTRIVKKGYLGNPASMEERLTVCEDHHRNEPEHEIADCGVPDNHVAQANAALIAAAPETAAERDRLIIALRACVEALEAAGGDGDPGDMPTPALDAARMLLAEIGDEP